MNSNFEADLEALNEEMLRYVGVTNLDFRTSLSGETLEEVKKMLFSINTLRQISFKDDIGVEDIEHVKHLIELSPMCDDKQIEKLILKKNNPGEIKKILSMHFSNPDTWNIAYDVKDDTYMITTLPNYRIMEEYINIVLSCIKEDMSFLEKVKEIYDFVKLLEYDEKGSSRLPDIIRDRKTNSLGFNLLFNEILKRIGIKSYIGEISRSTILEYVTLINVEDSKYDVSGIYVFDPSSDSVPKDMYKSEAIRKVNYNFFCLTLMEVVNTKEPTKLLGVLNLLNGDSFDYFNRKINGRDLKKLWLDFGETEDIIFDKVKKTKKIKDEKLMDLLILTVHNDDYLGLNRNIKELLRDNYYLRKKDLFNDDVKELEKINLHDV